MKHTVGDYYGIYYHGLEQTGLYFVFMARSFSLETKHFQRSTALKAVFVRKERSTHLMNPCPIGILDQVVPLCAFVPVIVSLHS